MYNRVDQLKILLNSIESFSSAIYEDGILRDIRFELTFREEKFLLQYNFDYCKPRLYHVRKDKTLTEVKEFIIPKEIKETVSYIKNQLHVFNDTFNPLIPGQEHVIGSVRFISKYLYEYANKNRVIDFVNVTYEVFTSDNKINEIELKFSKNNQRWETTEIKLQHELNKRIINMNIMLLENKILTLLNDMEKTENLEPDLLEVAEKFLRGME